MGRRSGHRNSYHYSSMSKWVELLQPCWCLFTNTWSFLTFSWFTVIPTVTASRTIVLNQEQYSPPRDIWDFHIYRLFLIVRKPGMVLNILQGTRHPASLLQQSIIWPELSTVRNYNLGKCISKTKQENKFPTMTLFLILEFLWIVLLINTSLNLSWRLL